MPAMRTESPHADGFSRPAPGQSVPPLRDREWLTTEEVAERTNTHYRTVARWASERLIEVDGGGHGDPWRWSEKNYREAFVLARLRHEGFSRQQLRASMRALRCIGHNPFSKGKFLVLENPTKRRGSRRRGSFVKIMEGGEALELCGSGQVQMLLPFPDAPWTAGRKS